MARSLEELIFVKRTALRYLLARESRLLALGKKPVNKKIANFVRTHQENNVWTSFMDSLNEDLTRNINVFEWKRTNESRRRNIAKRYRLDSTSRDILNHYKMPIGGHRMAEAPVVRVEQGKLQGRLVTSPTGKAFYSFQGVPYAKPPLGSLRFKAPQPPEPWDGIRDATSEGNVTAQNDPFFQKGYLGDENCLFLNVYTPNLDGEFLPVMVYIHGGIFRFGSGNTNLYGCDFLVEKDVVVVTLNYRCGALGFLSVNTPEVPGNAGLKDIVQAIRWVKENIQNFGGNPGNVTIFGESAGGAAVSLLAASPLSKNLISKAIIQSGTGLSNWVFQKSPLESARALAQELGCESTDAYEILEFLTSTPVKDIVDAQEKINPWHSCNVKPYNIFGVVVEKEFPGVEGFITEAFIDLITSGRVSDCPIMVGSTTLEFATENPFEDLQDLIPGELNVEKDSEDSLAIIDRVKGIYFNGNDHTTPENLEQYFHLLSDVVINVPIHRYVQYLTQVSNKPIYYYKFDYVGELNVSSKLGISFGLKRPMHMDELGYMFKNDYQKDVEPTPQDIKMRERVLRLWTNFAKTGNPTPDDSHLIPLKWQPVSKDNLYYLNLGSELSLETSPSKDKMDLWDQIYSKYYRIWEQTNTNAEEVPVKIPEPEPEVVECLIETVEETVITSEVVNDLPEEIAEEIPEKTPEEVPEKTPEEKLPEPEPEIIIESKVTNDVVDNHVNLNGVEKKPRPSNEIKMVQNSNGVPKDVIRANDPPEDDLPKNIGVNKFVNFFESLGGKK